MFHRFHDRHYVPIDVQQSKSWILMHTALVHTYVHHDAEGSGAWTRILSGKKLWFFVQPPHFGECESRTEYSEMIKPYLDCVTKRGYDARSYHSDSRCFFVRASAGDIMCVFYDLLQTKLILKTRTVFSHLVPPTKSTRPSHPSHRVVIS